MPYRFKLAEPIKRGFQRIGLEQIERAEHELLTVSNHEAAIHETRKCLKRIRALLRLVRAGLKPGDFARANAAFRQLGGLLSETRDNQVMLQTVAKLEAANVQAPLQGLKRAIMASRNSGSATDPGLLAAAVNGLREARQHFEGLKLAPANFGTLREGLERSYGHGRRVLEHAFADKDDEPIHDLRKRVQQHWRHMQLLGNAWPDYAAARVCAARGLSQQLGDFQDLSVLKAFVRNAPAEQLGPFEAKAIRRVIRERQGELRASALPHARRLFAEVESDLGRHFEVLWNTAKLMRERDREERPGELQDQGATTSLPQKRQTAA
jgi:CHAD domain-containing protein